MREWSDIHRQLEEALERVDFTSIGETMTTLKRPLDPIRIKSSTRCLYAGIHRSILSGLLTHTAERREKNLYCATGNREVMIFPGSNLYETERDRPGRSNPRTSAASSISTAGRPSISSARGRARSFPIRN